jgi:hypothetical protein
MKYKEKCSSVYYVMHIMWQFINIRFYRPMRYKNSKVIFVVWKWAYPSSVFNMYLPLQVMIFLLRRERLLTN